MSTGDTYIAGWKTADDWQAVRSKLVGNSDPSIWKTVFEDYFCTRLNLRYFGPIKTLQEHGTFQGEGFSILAIQCTLIEFLESTVQGLKYRYLRKGETLNPNEYSSSREIFVSFLCKRDPFAKDFDDTLAKDFYENIRCGLLHEARTKNGWKVWAKGPVDSIISRKQRIVYRDNFQLALDSFVDWYGKTLCSDNTLQEAFIRKFDDLCE